MDLATGAMGSLLPKLAELLNNEYKLQKGVKDGVISLEKEMKSMHAALRKVAGVPRDHLDEQIKLWAAEVRELSFDMEDVVDKFLVRADDDSEPASKSSKLKRLTAKMAGLFTKGKARHQIADAIKDINKQVQEVGDRRGRYTVDHIVARPAPVTTIDPRLHALYRELTELVGIFGKRDQELMKLLSDGDIVSNNKLKLVSVVGFGGLGKTTLVKTVYDKIKRDFDCCAFVPVGRNADAKKVFRDILGELGMCGSQLTILDERQLIDKLRESLENKRYLIVIDDIWDEKMWKVIGLAFSRSNNVGSRVITTTRIISVSKLCCSSTNDSVYQMMPLSNDDSKKLFYKRIFSDESGCPHEFEELSINLLKKCGGVPLAIITIASLLTSDQQVKPEDEWHALLESIGRGLTEDHSVEEMLRILSFSYYDLPSHLKTCLLYLSMFPEDYKIFKDQLIWMWIAESFVQCERKEYSLFEIGESYFNELVNRNLIQPVYHHEGEIRQVYACHVHDMVLDLIFSLACEDNFVTIFNGIGENISHESKCRRMSLQNVRKEELQTTPLESVSSSQVRTVAAFPGAVALMPPFSSFVVLRVLNLRDCKLFYHGHLKLPDLGMLIHLRYLGLANTGIYKLPKEVGKLQFLQVLDLRWNTQMEELPSFVIKLRRLMCLLVDHNCRRIPDGLGLLSSMEVLARIVCCESPSIVKELGKMKKLRELHIKSLSAEMEEALLDSLGKLPNIQILNIEDRQLDLLGAHWVPPGSLRVFEGVGFSTMPTWIRPSHLPQLYKLEIRVKKMQPEDMGFLGRLPSLRILILYSSRSNGLVLDGAHGFRCLVSFFLQPGPIFFQPGALPKAEKVELRISVPVAREEAAGTGGDFSDMGWENLSSLREASVTFNASGLSVGEARRAEAAMGNVLRAHPNRPTFRVSTHPYIYENPFLSVQVLKNLQAVIGSWRRGFCRPANCLSPAATSIKTLLVDLMYWLP